MLKDPAVPLAPHCGCVEISITSPAMIVAVLNDVWWESPAFDETEELKN
jgi:hypothetical protein